MNRIKVRGIKCDNPDCNYENDDVSWENPEETIKTYLNKPCPLCGASLLTQADVDTLEKIQHFFNFMNKVIYYVGFLIPQSWLKKREVEMHMNGTGKVTFKKTNKGEKDHG